MLDLFGFEASSMPAWCLTALFSWAVWALGLRLAWILPARYFGWGYSPRSFRYWLWLGIPWRPVYGVLRPVILWLRLLKFNQGDTDQFAGYFERAFHTFHPGQILLGRQSFLHLPCLQPLGLKTERGVTVVASVGSGKSSWLTAQLRMYAEVGNFMVVDCDGAIHDAIGPDLEKQGKQVIKLAPFEDGASWNALQAISEGVSHFGEDVAIEYAAVLAEGLIRKTHGQNEWVGFDSRAFLKTLILHVWRRAKPENRNLVYLRRLLTMGEREGLRPQDDAFLNLLAAMKLSPDFQGAVAAGAEMMLRSFSKSDGRSIPLSYCIEQTQWLDMPSVTRMSKHSDFNCLDLKAGKGGVCVFLVLPLQAIQGPLSGWVRTFVTMTMYAFQRDTRHRPKHPTLFALDEAAHLHLDMKTALGAFRKYGISVISIFQSVSQMREAYPDAWHDYLGLSECNLWMTSGDQGTLDFLSHTLGSSTRTERVEGNWPFGIEPRHQRENRHLLSPGQLKLLLKNNIIVTRADAPPMALKPIRHYVELPVSWLTPSSFYGEAAARSVTRRLLSFFTDRKALPPARPSIRSKKERVL